MASETSNLESELSAPEALPSQARVEKLFKWHGSKRQLAPQIVALFPPNYERLCYVEPFCGSAAVLFAKRRSSCEVLNDLDEDLLNFLVTVKMHALELYRTLRLLPNSRLEFARLMDCGGRCSSIVRAARWWYLNQTGFGGLGQHWAYQGHNGGKARMLSGVKRRIPRGALRLREVFLDCAPWQEEVEKLDGPDTLFYFDPPYLALEGYSSRFGESDWRDLRLRCQALKGKFVLSAEGSNVMKVMWRGFHQRLTATASSLGPNDSRQKELLVWNYKRESAVGRVL